MPVLTNRKMRELTNELTRRIDQLYTVIESRELKSASEGVKRGHWIKPEYMCATIGTNYEIRLAVEDFKTILAEIKKLK